MKLRPSLLQGCESGLGFAVHLRPAIVLDRDRKDAMPYARRQQSRHVELPFRRLAPGGAECCCADLVTASDMVFELCRSAMPTPSLKRPFPTRPRRGGMGDVVVT